MPSFPAFKTKPYYDALKTWLTTSLNEDGTLRSDAVQAEVSAAIADNQTVVDAAAAAVNATGLGTDVGRLKGDNPEAYQDFADDLNGVPVTLDSGQPWHHVGVGGDTAQHLRVNGGVLTSTIPSGSVAGYAEVELSGPVTRIGATVRYGPGTSNGGGALVIWSWQHSVAYLPDAPLHLRVNRDGFAVDVWDNANGGMVTLGGRGYASGTLAGDDATEYTYEALIDGDTAHVWCSTGDLLTVTDPRIASFAGPWACWEVFSGDGATESRMSFLEVWADTGATSERARHHPAVVQTHRQIEAFASTLDDVRRVLYVSETKGDRLVNLTGSYVEFDPAVRPVFTFPPSGRVLVTVQAAVQALAGKAVTIRVGWGAGLGFEDHAGGGLLVDAAYNGMVRFSCVVTLVPGLERTFYLGFYGEAGTFVYRGFLQPYLVMVEAIP